jgi:hypothetical protein
VSRHLIIQLSLNKLRARYYRRNLKQYINRGNQRTKVESILILLLESGGLYCVFWVRALLPERSPLPLLMLTTPRSC